MAAISTSIRRARRGDVEAIVRMLADDPLGSGRECLADPLPASYFGAFEALDRAREVGLLKRGLAQSIECVRRGEMMAASACAVDENLHVRAVGNFAAWNNDL